MKMSKYLEKIQRSSLFIKRLIMILIQRKKKILAPALMTINYIQKHLAKASFLLTCNIVMMKIYRNSRTVTINPKGKTS